MSGTAFQQARSSGILIHSSLPPSSACGMTSLFSGNAQIGQSGIFQALFPCQLHTQFCGDAGLPFPAHSDTGPGQCVPTFSTAPPYTICGIPGNPGILLLSLQLWPCTVIPLLVWGCTIPFRVVGALFSSATGAAEPAPPEGGRGCSTFPKHCTGGVLEASDFTTRVYVQ